MSLTVSDSGGGDFMQTPPGVHMARCYRVVDLGQQEGTYNGQPNLRRKILISWEVYATDELGQPIQTPDGEPLTISQRYTASLSDKAILRKHLDSWRGRPFSADELAAFDVSSVAGAAVFLNIIHEENNGKTYANISSLMPLNRAAMAGLPAPVLPVVTFDLDNPDWQAFETFHDKLKETINKSVEMVSIAQGKQRSQAGPAGAQAYAQASGGAQQAYQQPQHASQPATDSPMAPNGYGRTESPVQFDDSDSIPF